MKCVKCGGKTEGWIVCQSCFALHKKIREKKKQMDKICLNCFYYEVCYIDGTILKKGFCLIQNLYTSVDDDDTCDEWEACTARERYRGESI